MLLAGVIKSVLLARFISGAGAAIDRISDYFSLVGESDQRIFVRLTSSLDADPFNDVFKSEEHSDAEYRIHMVGDSTTRNQWSALCSLFGDSKVPKAETLKPSQECIGAGWGYSRLIATGTFNSVNATSASMMPEMITSALKAYNISKFDVIYFGSSALHLLNLFPAENVGESFWPQAINFQEEVSGMIKSVRSFTSCPIFHTLSHICDARHHPKRLKAYNDNYRNKDNIISWCRKRLPQAIDVCVNFSLTSEGTTSVAQIERRGIESSNTSIAVVDLFSLTYKQCWAAADGIHHIKILPLTLRRLSQHVRACQQAIKDGADEPPSSAQAPHQTIGQIDTPVSN